MTSLIKTTRRTGTAQAEYDALKELGFADWSRKHLENVTEDFVDKLLPARQITNMLLDQAAQNGRKVDLKVADDPAKLLQLSRNSGARAMTQIMGGIMEHHGLVPVTKGLQDALYISQGKKDKRMWKVDPKRERDFGAYLVALRALDEWRMIHEGTSSLRRAPLSVTEGDAMQTQSEMEAKYGDTFIEAAEIIHSYGMALLKKQYDAGLSVTARTEFPGMPKG